MAAALANWQLNEAAGARTMVDSSGNALNGTIGTHVQTGIALSGGGTGYRFPYIRPNTPPADPEHLVVVPHNTRLNPGSGNFAVEFRMRTTHSFGNIIQKGQAGSKGGYFKFQQPSGKVSACSGARWAAARPRPGRRSGSTTATGTRSGASARPRA